MGNRNSIRFVEISPDLDSIAVGLGLFRGDKAETVHFLASLKRLTDQLKCEGLVDLSFVGLRFWHLKNEPSSILILLILPLGFYPFSEELDGVDFSVGPINFIAA